MFLIRALVLTAALAAVSSAGDLNGKWKVRFLGDPMKTPKTFSEIDFEFKVQGKELTGTAHMGNWPGIAPIQEGKVDGSRVSFVAVGKSPWWSSSSSGSASGYPRFTFAGTIDGDKIKLHLVSDSVMIYGDAGKPVEYDLAGARTDEQ